MTISKESGVYFFTDSVCLGRDGSTVTASTGTVSEDYILNFNKAFAWQSDGSDDTTTETLTITFVSAQTIDSLFLLNHNFKQFNITYNGGSNFTNVKTVNLYEVGFFADDSGDVLTDENGAYFDDGEEDEFSITADEIYADDYPQNTSYYEFDSVSVSTIEISVTTTQVADEEETLNIFSAQNIIGNFSFAGIDKNNPNINYNTRQYVNILNKPFVRKGIPTFAASLRVPFTSIQADVDLIETLQDSDDDFIIWLCGGKLGTDYFSVNARPYRLEDVYRVQNTRASSSSFYQGVYVSGYSNALNVTEVA